MAAPFLLEIRTAGDLKSDLRDIMYDVKDEFGVYQAVQPRAVPHMTLFGPYNSDEGFEIKEAIQDALKGYDKVPYRIDGVGTFRQDVVYADVVPSEELRSLRRDLVENIEPLSYNHRGYDADRYYDYHITLALHDLDGRASEVADYIRRNYNLNYDVYAERVSNLNRSNLMWEWDLPVGRELNSDEATTRESWEQTNAALKKLKSPDDHRELAPEPPLGTRLKERLPF
jgi:2'-5' RNA ligase